MIQMPRILMAMKERLVVTGHHDLANVQIFHMILMSSQALVSRDPAEQAQECAQSSVVSRHCWCGWM